MDYTADQFATHLQRRGAQVQTATHRNETLVAARNGDNTMTAYFTTGGRFQDAYTGTRGRARTARTISLKTAVDALGLPAQQKVR